MAYSVPSPSRSRQRIQKEKNIKIGLRVWAMLFAVISLIIQGSFAAQTRPSLDEITLSWPFFILPQEIAFLTLSVLWCSVELVVLRTKRHSIHPGAHVALDLIIFGGLLSSAIIHLLMLSGGWFGPVTVSTHLPEVSVGFSVMVSFIEFALFVWACVDTDRLRKQEKRQTYIPPGMALVPIETLQRLHQEEYDASARNA